MLLDKYLPRIDFDSYEDFKANYRVNIPDDFNFGFDIVDEWAKQEPEKKALVWCNDAGEEKVFTFTDISRLSNQTANYFQSLGIKKGTVVMLILRRRWEYWICAVALHKIGAILIPGSLQLAKKDLIYRGNSAQIHTMVCLDDKYVLEQVNEAQPSVPSIQAILRGGYKKAYEAGVIITGGHTIHDQEPKYGLSVSGFVHPQKFLTNSGARPGDILILTKPLGVGILTTSAKAEFIDQKVMDKIYDQMRQLNKYARDIMVKYEVHSCTDVTGFGLLGHGYEMAQGSDVTIHFMTEEIPYHKEALSMADLGMIPEGAYRNRKYASAGVSKAKKINRALEDILYDPQTSGGLMIAVSENDAKNLLEDLQNTIPCAKIIGYIEEKEEKSIILE